MPEFFAYRTYWAIVAVALAACATFGYAIGGWIGAAVGGTLYVFHECVVVFFSWQPRP